MDNCENLKEKTCSFHEQLLMENETPNGYTLYGVISFNFDDIFEGEFRKQKGGVRVGCGEICSYTNGVHNCGPECPICYRKICMTQANKDRLSAEKEAAQKVRSNERNERLKKQNADYIEAARAQGQSEINKGKVLDLATSGIIQTDTDRKTEYSKKASTAAALASTQTMPNSSFTGSHSNNPHVFLKSQRLLYQGNFRRLCLDKVTFPEERTSIKTILKEFSKMWSVNSLIAKLQRAFPEEFIFTKLSQSQQSDQGIMIYIKATSELFTHITFHVGEIITTDSHGNVTITEKDIQPTIKHTVTKKRFNPNVGPQVSVLTGHKLENQSTLHFQHKRPTGSADIYCRDRTCAFELGWTELDDGKELLQIVDYYFLCKDGTRPDTLFSKHMEEIIQIMNEHLKDICLMPKHIGIGRQRNFNDAANTPIPDVFPSSYLYHAPPAALVMPIITYPVGTSQLKQDSIDALIAKAFTRTRNNSPSGYFQNYFNGVQAYVTDPGISFENNFPSGSLYETDMKSTREGFNDAKFLCRSLTLMTQLVKKGILSTTEDEQKVFNLIKDFVELNSNDIDNRSYVEGIERYLNGDDTHLVTPIDAQFERKSVKKGFEAARELFAKKKGGLKIFRTKKIKYKKRKNTHKKYKKRKNTRKKYKNTRKIKL